MYCYSVFSSSDTNDAGKIAVTDVNSNPLHVSKVVSSYVLLPDNIIPYFGVLNIENWDSLAANNILPSSHLIFSSLHFTQATTGSTRRVKCPHLVQVLP